MTASDPENNKAVYSWLVKERPAGTDVLITKAETQTNSFSWTYICAQAPMNIYLLVHIHICCLHIKNILLLFANFWRQILSVLNAVFTIKFPSLCYLNLNRQYLKI